jgi:hypothetical protein
MDGPKTNRNPATNSVSPGSLSGWRQVLELSKQMLQAAKGDEWEKLAEIEKERRDLLYTSPPLHDDTTILAIRQIVQQVLSIDEQIITLCQDGQQVLAGKLKFMRVGQRAQRAYGIQ